MPRGRERAGLRLAVADRHRDQKVRIVEGGAEGMRDRVTQLAALVNGSRRLGRAVRADAARERELLEEGAHAFFILAFVGVDLGVGALQIDRCENARGAVARAGEEDRLLRMLLDDPVEVHIHEGEAGTRAPMTEQTFLQMTLGERLAQQRVVPKIDHACGEVVAGTPVGIDSGQQLGGDGIDVDLGRGEGARHVILRDVVRRSCQHSKTLG